MGMVEVKKASGESRLGKRVIGSSNMQLRELQLGCFMKREGKRRGLGTSAGINVASTMFTRTGMRLHCMDIGMSRDELVGTSRDEQGRAGTS